MTYNSILFLVILLMTSGVFLYFGGQRLLFFDFLKKIEGVLN